jgi:hypothetical protein
MARRWAFAGVMAVVAMGSVVTAQERVAPTPEMVVKLKSEAAQLPLAVKTRVPLESKVVTGAPYSAEIVTETVETLADGNRIVHRTTGRVYRDGQGRVRREEDRGNGQAASVFITDPVAHVSYALEPENKVAMKTTGDVGGTFFYTTADGENATVVTRSTTDPGDVERKRRIEQTIVATAPVEGDQVVMLRAEPSVRIAAKIAEGGPAWDSKVEKLPARQVEGVSAEGTRTTRTIPAGAIGNERPIVMVTEEWRSTDLQVLVLTTTSDPRTGESTYKLVNIVRGEPGASWFEVPAGFTVNDAGVRKNFVIKRDAK